MPRGRATRRVKTLDTFAAEVEQTREVQAAYSICSAVYLGNQCSCSRKRCEPCHPMRCAVTMAKRFLVPTTE